MALLVFTTIAAVPIVGAVGPAPITSSALTPETASTPLEETAKTLKVLVVPWVIPLTTIGLLFPVAD